MTKPPIELSPLFSTILTMRESVGVPEEVSAKRPMIERKRIPIAKVQFRLENGMRTTIIDGEITDICHFLQHQLD